jgi:hypothetical protein
VSLFELLEAIHLIGLIIYHLPNIPGDVPGQLLLALLEKLPQLLLVLLDLMLVEFAVLLQLGVLLLH